MATRMDRQVVLAAFDEQIRRRPEPDAVRFMPEPTESLLVAEMADLTLDAPPPPGVELLAVDDKHAVEALVRVHDEVFGGDHCAIGRTLLDALARQPTLPAWRGQGVFCALVAHRATLASARGFRYLEVDASPESRPILQRLGFVELATTTPFMHPGGAG